ncbi:Uncharacterized protein Fot_06714 [Forsythia ovata]|uniref:Uncharacterized protein n=1 Tax=Forsythia ovata TaxID=205694 RepID=A0ABD1WTR1_9LAMI
MAIKHIVPNDNFHPKISVLKDDEQIFNRNFKFKKVARRKNILNLEKPYETSVARAHMSPVKTDLSVTDEDTPLSCAHTPYSCLSVARAHISHAFQSLPPLYRRNHVDSLFVVDKFYVLMRKVLNLENNVDKNKQDPKSRLDPWD